jgi:hypothetical protein
VLGEVVVRPMKKNCVGRGHSAAQNAGWEDYAAAYGLHICCGNHDNNRGQGSVVIFSYKRSSPRTI